jgi:hypothetical protein
LGDQYPIPQDLVPASDLHRFAYERLAKGLMRWAPPVLESVDMPTDVSLEYDVRGLPALVFDLAIGPKLDSAGSLVGFRVCASSLAPAFVLGVCSHFHDAVSVGNGEIPSWARDPAVFRTHVELFGTAYAAAVGAFSSGGLVAAVDAFYNSLGLSTDNMNEAANYFDVCSHFMTNHEIAHAYSGQMTLALGTTSNADQRGFEHIADSLAAEWLYNLFIRETPDAPAYRAAFGHVTHGDAIRSNVTIVYRAQLLVLLTLLLASAGNSDGSVSLAGHGSHPHTLMRHIAVNVHLATLVLSNQDEHVSEAALDALDDWLHQWTQLFLESGLIDAAGLMALQSPARLDDLRAARDLIRRCRIESLSGLANAIDMLPNQLGPTRAST